LPFFDTDTQIMLQEGQSITAIFNDHGEAYFRLLERQQIDQLPNKACVVACGGGLPCYGDLFAALVAKGTVVYLKASADVLFERIQDNSTRPLRADKASFQALLTEREVVYEKAQIVIAADQTIEQLVSGIKNELSKT
jgi:shikimate kinase